MPRWHLCATLSSTGRRSASQAIDISANPISVSNLPSGPAMEGSAPGSKGRPSKVAPYASQVAQWLREAPDISGAEVLSRVRLAGYRGGKSALYEFVKQLRTPEFGYKRCPRCRVMVRDIAEFCPRCGLGLPSTLPHLPVQGAEAAEAAAPITEAIARRQTPRVPAIK